MKRSDFTGEWDIVFHKPTNKYGIITYFNEHEGCEAHIENGDVYDVDADSIKDFRIVLNQHTLFPLLKIGTEEIDTDWDQEYAEVKTRTRNSEIAEIARL
jgi:hypothetical protein